MYHSIINVSIISKTHDLENWLLTISVNKPYECRFCTYDTFADTALVESDIIIYDLPYSSDDFQLQILPQKDAMFILCIPPEVTKELSCQEYAFIDYIWPQPLHQDLATYYFSKTIEQYVVKKDLWLSQKYLDSLIDAVPDMIWFKDVSGEHLKVNNSFCEAVGKSKEDVIGKYHYYIWDIPKEEYEAGEYVCLDTDEIVLREKKTRMFHEKVKIKNSMRQLITYKSPIFSESGEPICTVGIARDVTDWVNMKAELEVVLEKFPFPLLFLDVNGIVLSANISFENCFNTKKTGVVGCNYKKWASLIFENYAESGGDMHSKAVAIIDNEKKFMTISKEQINDVFGNIAGTFISF